MATANAAPSGDGESATASHPIGLEAKGFGMATSNTVVYRLMSTEFIRLRMDIILSTLPRALRSRMGA